MGFNRRNFLQKAGLGIGALGVSETLLSLLFDGSRAVPILDRYGRALAQPTRRKLAILVGINQYQQMTALGGCVTDVAMQRELLIHRFGFSDRDILTLTDSQATRTAIETGFVEHLIKQARAGDVAVFHFSGYGSRVQRHLGADIDRLGNWDNSFVTVDGAIPTNGIPARDLLAETLRLLLLSLSTSNVTTILDTAHINRVNSLEGTLRVRNPAYPPVDTVISEELAFQEELLGQLNPVQRGNISIMPGLYLAATGLSPLAMEAKWNGFTAGLFTYCLTQYLWQAMPPTTVQITMSRTAANINQLIGINQQPQLGGDKYLDPVLPYDLDPHIGADGVVTSLDSSGTTVQLWLGGLPGIVTQYYGINSLLELVNENALQRIEGSETADVRLGSGEGYGKIINKQQPITHNQKLTSNNQQLQIRTKDGLRATAQLIPNTTIPNTPIKVGQLVEESVRILPRNVTLTIALDTKLERIERVDATSAFASIYPVSSVVIAGEQPADYLFGKRIKEGSSTNLLPNAAPGYGLFYLGGEPIRNTAGESGEAVKSAVTRLLPQLNTLLGSKLLRLTENEGSSKLAIKGYLETIFPEEKTIAIQAPARGFASLPSRNLPLKYPEFLPSVKEGKLPSIPRGSRIQCRLENYSDLPIYFILLGFQTGANAIAFFPHSPSSSLPSLRNGSIAPGQSLIIPDPAATFDWAVAGLPGVCEIQLIASPFPFTGAMAKLQAGMISTVKGERIDNLLNSLDVAQAILQDLHQGSGVTSDRIGIISDSYVLDVNAWATLSFIYEVY